MSKLGYTWYPQNWRASKTFRRLRKYPLVRYALREIFDLMYEEHLPIEMNREFLEEDFGIILSDDEYDILMKYIVVDESGLWWSNTVEIRLSKAESSRKNGAKGGRPKNPKTQNSKPKETQDENPKNPPLEREREREREKESVLRAHAREGILTKKDFTRVIPTQKEFLDFAIEKERDIDQRKIILRYEAWKENEWKDTNGMEIKNWKTKLLYAMSDIGKFKQSNSEPFVKKYQKLN